MSNSKPLSLFAFDVLYYFSRDELERFSIVCRPLKNFINRYFHSKPYRVFDCLRIRGGSYALFNSDARWHPNQKDVRQLLAAQFNSIHDTYYSFPVMRPYFVSTVRIKWTFIDVARSIAYNSKHIAEMEYIAFLWRDFNIYVMNDEESSGQIVPEGFQRVLNSTILQCQLLSMHKLRFSFKCYKILYAVKVMEVRHNNVEDIDLLQEFLEQPGDKPVVVFNFLCHENVIILVDRFSKAFTSAVSENAFKIVFVLNKTALTEFRESNTTSGEKLELKEGFPSEYQAQYSGGFENYTLERSNI